MRLLEVLLVFLIFVSATLGLSLRNWVIMWGAIEIRIFCFLPLLRRKGKSFIGEGALKYFFIQSRARLILLIIGFHLYQLYSEGFLFPSFFSLGLILKLGLWPFHYWILPVVSLLKEKELGLMLGPLKIIPLGLLRHLGKIINEAVPLFLWGVIRALVGAMLGNGCSKTTHILGASSISHSGWLVMARVLGSIWTYFLLYLLALYLLLLSWTCLKYDRISLILIRLRGIPPFFLFYGKYRVIATLITQGCSLYYLLLLLLGALVRLNFYLKFSYSYLLNIKITEKVRILFSVALIFNLMGTFFLFLL